MRLFNEDREPIDSKEQEAILRLIRKSLKNENVYIPDNVNWSLIYNWSCTEGIAPIVFDALDKYCAHESLPIPNEIIMRWYVTCERLKKYYHKQEQSIKALQAILAEHSIKLMILKGWGLSLLYPQPSLRTASDVDIYLFGKYKEADKLLNEQFGIKIDFSEHHHTIFKFKGVTFENHYDFINIHANESANWLEKEFKKLASSNDNILKDGIYLPSPTLNALFLLRHSAQHFAGEKLTLRQLIDWALFCEHFGNDVDWDYVKYCSKKVGMIEFLSCLNECKNALLNTKYEFKCETSKRIWDDIWTPTIGIEPNGMGKYPFKFRRWWQGRWKRTLVFNGSLTRQFFILWRSHIISPR